MSVMRKQGDEDHDDGDNDWNGGFDGELLLFLLE